jgi:hypothetical protein
MWEPVWTLVGVLVGLIVFLFAPFTVLYFFGLAAAIGLVIAYDVLAFVGMFLSTRSFWPVSWPAL